MTIDIHAHVFNAQDLQVRLFLTKVAASGLAPVVQELIVALAPLLEFAGWEFAPSGDVELERLAMLSATARARGISAFALEQEFASDRERGRQAFLNGFTEALKLPEGERFLRAYDAYRRFLQKSAPNQLQSADIFTRSVEAMRVPEGLADFLAAERSLDGKRPLTFAANFFNFRYVNALYLLENYGCTHGKVGIFACHMVDFDYGLGATDATPTDLDMQIEVMGRIHELSNGRILPFAPFDPWRNYFERGAALQRVKDAVSAGKCLGVKLYPPMGFAPAGNARIKPVPAGWPNDPGFPPALDSSMKALFDWCIAEGVPVLAHANPSNAAHSDFDRLGSPERWSEALTAHKQLRVCFGHFGGDCLLAQSAECSNWARGFLKAFAHGPYVYADWSYFAHVLSDDDREELAKRAKALFDEGGSLAQERIAYGSDWIMLAIEAGAERYYSHFAELERELELAFPGITDQFFVKNGARFLNLLRGGSTRWRIEQTFARQGTRPAWLDAPLLQLE